MIQFSSSLATICIELFILSFTKYIQKHTLPNSLLYYIVFSDYMNVTNRIFVATSYLGEMAIYCFAGSLIYEEVRSIRCRFIYVKQNNFREKTLSIIIMISIGGKKIIKRFVVAW